MSEEGGGEKVPLWIISFADMITLLLSFFVMLQTMSHARDATLFGVAQDSFRRAISGLGIPDLLFGKQVCPLMDYRKLKYPMEESEAQEPTRERVIDAEDENIRRMFAQLEAQAEVTTSSQAKTQSSFSLPIRFAPGRADLDAGAQAQLKAFAVDLRSATKGPAVHLYVVGQAPDEQTSVDRAKLAARRARAVEQSLTAELGSQVMNGWTVRSLGAADSGFISRGADGQAGAHIVVLVRREQAAP